MDLLLNLLLMNTVIFSGLGNHWKDEERTQVGYPWANTDIIMDLNTLILDQQPGRFECRIHRQVVMLTML